MSIKCVGTQANISDNERKGIAVFKKNCSPAQNMQEYFRLTEKNLNRFFTSCKITIFLKNCQEMSIFYF